MPQDPARVTTDKLTCWLAGQGWSPDTKKSYRSAVASFFAWACDAGHLPTDPAARCSVICTHQHT